METYASGDPKSMSMRRVSFTPACRMKIENEAGSIEPDMPQIQSDT